MIGSVTLIIPWTKTKPNKGFHNHNHNHNHTHILPTLKRSSDRRPIFKDLVQHYIPGTFEKELQMPFPSRPARASRMPVQPLRFLSWVHLRQHLGLGGLPFQHLQLPSTSRVDSNQDLIYKPGPEHPRLDPSRPAMYSRLQQVHSYTKPTIPTWTFPRSTRENHWGLRIGLIDGGLYPRRLSDTSKDRLLVCAL